MLRPQTMDIMKDLYSTFVKDNRWKYFFKGLGNTLLITLVAAVIGVVLGLIIAVVRSSADKWKKNDGFKSFFSYFHATRSAKKAKKPYKRVPAGRLVLYFFDVICRIYLTVIRGTPVVVQLLIFNFAILINSEKLLVAFVAFGLNSAAYVAEIIRSGIMSIDQGQEEAGRSLGMSYVQTMLFVILPQALKNILPALVNEAIVLLKETSVSGYIALNDLTKGGDIVRSITYNSFSLFVVAAIYLLVVMLMTFLLGKLERRLRASER